MGDIRTYAQMKNCIGSDEMNKVNTAMRKKMTAEDKDKLGRACDTDRVAWIKQYLIDPQTSLKKGIQQK